MKKSDAAKFLNIGVRTLEKYTSDGHIKATREKGAHGHYLDYSDAELNRFKAWLDARNEAPPQGSPQTGSALALPDVTAIVADSQSERADRVLTALETISSNLNDNTQSERAERVLAALESLAARFAADDAKQTEKESVADLRAMKMLTIPQAARAFNVSPSALKGAINAGQIDVYIGLGRARRVMTAQVEAWIESL